MCGLPHCNVKMCVGIRCKAVYVFYLQQVRVLAWPGMAMGQKFFADIFVSDRQYDTRKGYWIGAQTHCCSTHTRHAVSVADNSVEEVAPQLLLSPPLGGLWCVELKHHWAATPPACRVLWLVHPPTHSATLAALPYTHTHTRV